MARPRLCGGKILSLREEDLRNRRPLARGGPWARHLQTPPVPGFTSHIIVSLTLSVARHDPRRDRPQLPRHRTCDSPVVSWGVMLQDCMNIDRSWGQTTPWLPYARHLYRSQPSSPSTSVGDGMRDAADPYASRLNHRPLRHVLRDPVDTRPPPAQTLSSQMDSKDTHPAWFANLTLEQAHDLRENALAPPSTSTTQARCCVPPKPRLDCAFPAPPSASPWRYAMKAASQHQLSYASSRAGALSFDASSLYVGIARLSTTPNIAPRTHQPLPPRSSAADFPEWVSAWTQGSTPVRFAAPGIRSGALFPGGANPSALRLQPPASDPVAPTDRTAKTPTVKHNRLCVETIKGQPSKEKTLTPKVKLKKRESER